jgi:hypothetical protein
MARRFHKNRQIVDRQVRDEQILVPLQGDRARLDCLYTLNETAAFIWRRAGAGLTEEEIAAELAAEYEVSLAAAGADTRRVLDELTGLDLIAGGAD